MSAKPLAHAHHYDAESTEATKSSGRGSKHYEETTSDELEEAAAGTQRGADELAMAGDMTEEEWAEIYSRLVPIYEAVPPPPGVDPASDWYLELTDEDLPYEDGIPMESALHARQLQLLADAVRPEVEEQGHGMVGDDMFIYFCREQVEGKYVRGPDFFVSLDVEPNGKRRSYVVWQEGKPPEVIIELLSLSTAKKDKTEKKQTYQDDLKVKEYYWFDPFRPDDFAGFVLENGLYVPMTRDEGGRYVSQVLGLALTRWEGIYMGVHGIWLRWARLSGELLPTPQELAAAATQRAEREAQAREESELRAAAAAQHAEREAKAREESELRAAAADRAREESELRAAAAAQRAELLAKQLAEMMEKSAGLDAAKASTSDTE